MKISSSYYGVVFGGVCDMDRFCKVELGSYRWGWGGFRKKVFQSNKNLGLMHTLLLSSQTAVYDKLVSYLLFC